MNKDTGFRDANRKVWDEWTTIHMYSKGYDISGFKAGHCTLRTLEQEEVGQVQGNSLLHLQCHFGLDTLSWARLGAKVTGVDFSEKAIAMARSLAAEMGLPATFIHSDVYELPAILHDKFDIVFSSYEYSVGWTTFRNGGR